MILEVMEKNKFVEEKKGVQLKNTDGEKKEKSGNCCEK